MEGRSLKSVQLAWGPAQISLPALECPPRLPFAPGKSPFRVKGTIYVGLMTFTGSVVPGGARAVIDKVEQPEVRSFLEQRFLVGSWYDFLPMFEFFETAGQLAHIPTCQFVARHAFWETDRHLTGLYRLLLTVTSPEFLARRVPSAWKSVFDFGSIDDLSVTTGEQMYCVSGLPAPLLPWYRVSLHTIALRLLERTGARDVLSFYTQPEADGNRAGVNLVRFGVRRTWER